MSRWISAALLCALAFLGIIIWLMDVEQNSAALIMSIVCIGVAATVLVNND